VSLVAREEERAWLETAAAEAIGGRGALVLLAGEAGVGKTRLAEDVLSAEDARFLRSAATPAGDAYGALTGALRAFLRGVPEGLTDCGPLRRQLALVLPELGDPLPAADRATLVEAFRCALAAVARHGPALILLDDLQWSDAATLETLGALAEPLCELPILVIAAYRSDETPRGHALRRLRTDLRRMRLLREIEIEPLDAAATATLAELTLGSPPSPRLARTLHERTQGVPFFVEELAAALDAGGRLESGASGLELALDAHVPLPQTIRDAVLLRTAGLSERGRAAAETAAVAGARFELEPVAALGHEDALGELVTSGLVVEVEAEPGLAAFRHPLARDAIYEDVPWLRRRALHRALAGALEERGAGAAGVAAHWLAARDNERALDALTRAATELAAVHAHRDAARLGRQALDLWPEGERGTDRIALLERHARSAELAGELAEAASAQREVVAVRRTEGVGRALADAERRLAGICELQGDRERALAARRVAADAFVAIGLSGEAAAERLIAAGYLQSAGVHSEAVELARDAGAEARRAERTDLRARALGLEGVARAKRGEFEQGIETVRSGLSLALDHELTAEAAEVYQRLGTALETAADYGGAREALSTAIGLCETGTGQEHVCLSCMVYVLRELGDWDRSAEMALELNGGGRDAATTLVADGVLGSIYGFRGDARRARPLLERCHATAARINVISMLADSAAALAWLDEREGAIDAATSRCRLLLERWERTEDNHYAVWCLRHAASFFARSGSSAEARACAEALSAVAARTGHADALAALAHALGETALADGEPEAAADQLTRALELHEGLDIPFERAQIMLRAGVACAAAGRREAALEHLAGAHRLGRRLGSGPLAADAAAAVEALGEPVQQHLGRRAAAHHENAGLSERELEVMRLVASGHTNREIAAELVLSTRTVDMHVRNILAKLRCRTRTEAAARAGDLGLLV